LKQQSSLLRLQIKRTRKVSNVGTKWRREERRMKVLCGKRWGRKSGEHKKPKKQESRGKEHFSVRRWVFKEQLKAHLDKLL
jgi:hypothetical protein